MKRAGFLLLGAVLLGVGGLLIQGHLEERSSGGYRSRGSVGSMAVFVGGIFCITKAIFPGEDDEE